MNCINICLMIIVTERCTKRDAFCKECESKSKSKCAKCKGNKFLDEDGKCAGRFCELADTHTTNTLPSSL